jgi:hypothetical protein
MSIETKFNLQENANPLKPGGSVRIPVLTLQVANKKFNLDLV